MNLWEYLTLDSFGVVANFSQSKEEFINFFNENHISLQLCDETKLIIISRLFSLDIDFYISFQFIKGRLVAIAASPDGNMEEKSAHKRYKRIQRALENILGTPKKHIFGFLRLFDPKNRLSYWLKEGKRIKHSLQDRFGLEECICIEL